MIADLKPYPAMKDTGVPRLGEVPGHWEVLPHAADAWFDPASVKIGYKISFTRYFYKPRPLRTLEEIASTSWPWRRRPRGCSARSWGSG